MATSNQTTHGPADIQYVEPGVLRCTGRWTLADLRTLETRLPRFPWPEGAELVMDGQGIAAMDTAGAWLLHRTVTALEQQGRQVSVTGLKSAHRSLLDLVAGHAPAARPEKLPPEPKLVGIGRASWLALQELGGFLAFTGEAAAVLLPLLVRPTRFRWRVLLANTLGAGYRALGIVGLLAFLLGVVIAYQGASLLALYGADIYVGDLVGLSMMRELAPMVTAIIVAGRTGSAYTAQIGTMRVTEELDAMRTIGIHPMEMLVLPKLFALILALPLLTVFADLMGVVGGMVMARLQLGLGFGVFLDRVQEAVTLTSYLIGVGKAPVFAAIIALVGCYQGFQVTGGAESVGTRTTTSVVQSIFLVIVTDAMFSVLFSWLDI